MNHSLSLSLIYTQSTARFEKRSPFFTAMQAEILNTLDL